MDPDVARDHAGHELAVADQLRRLGRHHQAKLRIAPRLALDEGQEVRTAASAPSGGSARAQLGEVGSRHALQPRISSSSRSCVVCGTASSSPSTPASCISSSVDGWIVSPRKSRKKLFSVLLEHDHVDAGTCEQPAEHHARPGRRRRRNIGVSRVCILEVYPCETRDRPCMTRHSVRRRRLAPGPDPCATSRNATYRVGQKWESETLCLLKTADNPYWRSPIEMVAMNTWEGPYVPAIARAVTWSRDCCDGTACSSPALTREDAQ